MTNVRKNHDFTSIPTPYGLIHVWQSKRGKYGSSSAKEGTIGIELDEADGGFLMPTGEAIHSYANPNFDFLTELGVWSIHSGFMASEDKKPNLAYRVTPKKEKKLDFNDPAFEFISDLLFDLLVADLLPTEHYGVAYHRARQDAVKAYYAKSREIEALASEINDFKNTQIEEIAKVAPHTSRHLFPRVRAHFIQ